MWLILVWMFFFGKFEKLLCCFLFINFVVIVSVKKGKVCFCIRVLWLFFEKINKKFCGSCFIFDFQKLKIGFVGFNYDYKSNY